MRAGVAGLVVVVLTAAVAVFQLIRVVDGSPPSVTPLEPQAIDGEFPDAGLADRMVDETRRTSVAIEPSGTGSLTGGRTLRVVLDGVTDDAARLATVIVTGVDERTFDARLATVEQRRARTRWLQDALNRAVGNGIVVDGNMGSRTRRAIMDFQRREGLSATGRIDLKTERALARYDDTQSYMPPWPAEIRGTWKCQGPTSEFDLEPFFTDVAKRGDGQRVDGLEIEIDHPLHFIETIRVPLSDGAEQTDGRVVFEVRVRLTSAAVIHGRLARAGGAPVADGMVGALLLEDGAQVRSTTDGSTLVSVPVEGEGRAVECAADGTFELRVSASGAHALVSYEDGWRPTTTRVEAVIGSRVDVGTIVLELGNAITGRVLRRGAPLVGASVELRAPKMYWAADPADVAAGMKKWIRNARVFRTHARSVVFVWLEDRFELRGRRFDVDESGVFAFPGLASVDYRLRVVEVAGSRFVPNGWDNPTMREEGPDETVVRAPAHGVVMEFPWSSIRFELAGGVERADTGRLILKTRSLYRGNEFTHIPEFWSTQFALSGSEPSIVVQAPPTTRILGEVVFPGYQPVSLDFVTPKAGGELVVPVRPERDEQAATLVVALENQEAEIPEAFTILLRRGAADATPEMRRLEVVDGRLRLENILPGEYRVSVCAGEDPNHTRLFIRHEFRLDLRPGRVVTRSIRMRKGAGVRVRVRNAQGEPLAGRYEFFDLRGNRVSLCLVVSDRWEPGSDRWATLSTIHPLGVHESSSPLQPGRYRLVVVATGYESRSVTVELRAGEYVDVDVTLRK